MTETDDPIHEWYTTFDRQADRLRLLLATIDEERKKPTADCYAFCGWVYDTVLDELAGIDSDLRDARTMLFDALDKGDDDDETN